MNFKALKKKLVLALAIVMMVSSFGATFAATSFSDLNKAEWAKETILKWSGFGLVSGYSDGTFRPSNNITRAEFTVMAFKAFDLESNSRLMFRDVKTTDWFYQQVSKMAKLGYINGYEDGTFRPNAPITRAEAAAIIANIMNVTPDAEGASTFVDMNEIPVWARGFVGAVAKAGFVSGYTDSTFRASNNISRAESVAMLNNTVYNQNHFAKDWRIVEPGTYGGTKETPVVVQGNVYVKSADVVLENIEIKGKLVIGVEVGEGDATLNEVVVAGDTNVYGGGVNSVKINGGSYGKIFVLKSAATPVRLLVINAKNVDVVIPQANSKVVLEGVFNSVSVLAQNIQVKTQGNTSINEMTFDKLAVDVEFETSEGTVIATVIVNVKLTVLGQGRIITADVNVEGVTFTKQPEVVNNVPTVTPPPVVSNPPSGGDNNNQTPSTVNYNFQVQKNNEPVRSLRQHMFLPTQQLGFTVINTIYNQMSEIPFGYTSLKELLMLENPENGSKTYAEGLAAKVIANSSELEILGNLYSEFEAVLNNVATDNFEDSIDTLASSLLEHSLRDIFNDLEILYANVDVPSRITFKFYNGTTLGSAIEAGKVEDLETFIDNNLKMYQLSAVSGKAVMQVILDDSKTFTLYVNYVPGN